MKYFLQILSLLFINHSLDHSQLDNAGIIYDQPKNKSICVQCNACVTIAGAIRGTSQIKLYDELGLKSLKYRLWFRHLCTLYKIQSSSFSDCLFKLIPKITNSYNTRTNVCRAFWCRPKHLKIDFSTLSERTEQVKCQVCNSKSCLELEVFNASVSQFQPP